MKNPLFKVSLLTKILLSTSVAMTVLFAITAWIVVSSASRTTSESVQHEVQASFEAYQSLWRSRADRLASVSSVLSAMSDVRAAFGTGDEATIRDTAAELWSRVSRDDAFFIVATPSGRTIASLGGAANDLPSGELPVVRDSISRFPSQTSGFISSGASLYHITVTPVYVQSTGGPALLDVLVAGYAVNRAVAEDLKNSTGGSEFVFFSNAGVVASTLPAPEASIIGRQLSRTANLVHAGDHEYAPLVSPLLDLRGNPVGRLAVLRTFDTANREISALRRNMSLLWLASMLVGLSLTYVMARRIVGPVRELDRAAAEVARQNYDCQVRADSEDELGRLGATFNAMCASIRQAREELIRTERIATVGRLAASIVHDLRNPLAAIYGGAEMLMDRQLSDAQVRRLAGNMYKASAQVQQLLQDLLDAGRGQTGQVQQCSLRDIVASVADALSATAEAHSVELRIEVPEELELPLNRRRIERVFLNLIGNALDAMPEGGIVTVSAARQDNSIVVQVADTGPGIAPEIRGRLFQPFVTARKASGLGLGLALARQAVVDHGGDMWANPSNGDGASFSFRLPLTSQNNN